MSKKRICLTCSKDYEYCHNCSNDKNKKQNTWKMNYCSENCRDIFKTCIDYVGGKITIQEAKQLFDTYNTNFIPRKNVMQPFYEIKMFESSVIEESRPDTIVDETLENVGESLTEDIEIDTVVDEPTTDSIKDDDKQEESIEPSEQVTDQPFSRRRRRMKREENE